MHSEKGPENGINVRAYRTHGQSICNTEHTEDSCIAKTERYSTVFVKLRQ